MLGRAALVLAVGLGLALLPTAVLEGAPPICLSRLLLDSECFGCGMTRALSCVAHGELFKAFAYNRGVVIVGPLLVGIAVRWVLGRPVPAASEAQHLAPRDG